MKLPLAALGVLLTLISSHCFAQSDFYTNRWGDVYKYEMRVLPKSALAVVDSIYSRAKQEKNIQQLTKTLIYQSKFALTLHENAELLVIQKFQREIKDSKPPLKNILESIVANIYWQYLSENRGKYYARSRTANKINTEDFRTWDAEAMFQEIHKHYQNSLRDAASLQKISLKTIQDILIQTDNSKLYRPTLYDLLAHNALGFYQTSESLITKPIIAFVLKDERYFEEFERMVISSPDSLSPHLQALTIFHRLLLLHRQRKDTAAFVNVEIERLQFLVNEGTFKNASSLHKKALTKLHETFKNHPASTLLNFEIASILNKEGNDYKPNLRTQNQFKKREALAVCNQAIADFPQSDGAKKCEMLRENILIKKLKLTAEKFVSIDLPSRVLVDYTNIDTLSFTVFRITADFNEQLLEHMNDSVRLATITGLNQQNRWRAGLTNLHDHQPHTTEVVVPRLPQGRYLIFARVTDPFNSVSDNIYGYSTIQVTNLALLQSNFIQHHSRYQVVDRNNGKPLSGADVHLKAPVNYDGHIDEHFNTNSDGFFEVKDRDKYISQIKATVNYQGDQAVFGDYYMQKYDRTYGESENLSGQIFLFSDRSIYRPGQTVFFKGIMVKTRGKITSVVPGEYVEVFLEDVNGQEIKSLRLKTNSYGSFSGEFKLPASGLTGEYTIDTDEDSVSSKFYDKVAYIGGGRLNISVEEYKRPTFEASFKPVKETFKVNDTVTVEGTAIAFSGSKITNAKVSYHVKRIVRYPHWYYWYHPGNRSEEQEIAFGEKTTNNVGEFSIDFKALPDESVSAVEKPVFHYEITADITDINGETRSASVTVKVGYHALLATITAASVIDRKAPANTVSISTENLNGQPVFSKGTIEIYKLMSPAAPLRPRPWKEPDLQALTLEQFKSLFPHDAYGNESDPHHWKKGKLLLKKSFDTQLSTEMKVKIDRSWELGSYVMELKTRDASNEEVTDMHRFNVIDATSTEVPDNQLLFFELDKPGYQPGETARLRIGSASPDITVTIDIEENHAVSRTYVEHLSGNVKEIIIPVAESRDHGFAVHCSAVSYNAFLSEKKTVPVITRPEKIEIETNTFKDKLQPGAKETWSFAIKGKNQAKKETEILASMYDASLDQFKSHEWSFNPIHRTLYNSYNRTSAYESFGHRNFSVKNEDYGYFVIPQQHYDELDWFGFSITNDYHIHQRYRERLYLSGADREVSVVVVSHTRNLKKGYIYGKISTVAHMPLPGVNITAKGTTRTVITDAEGNYMIKANKDEMLVYTFIGYVPAEAKVGRKNTMDVTMQEEAHMLSEVVVTAYGVQKRSQMLAASATRILQDSAATEFAFSTDLLSGKLAGIQITGMAGSNARIMIRGNASFGDDAEPMYVVDGVIVESSKIDHGDLATVQVLKGPAATTLYGVKAANGVLIITTKSGQKKLDEELAKVTTRKNFNETAFFFPHLRTDENGKVNFTFTTPEALTRWKLQLLAHTKNAISSIKTLQAVTQKELMATPNVPRFLRIGDDIVFSTKIVNLSGRATEGSIALQLFNAATGEPVDQAFKNSVRNQAFRIEAKGSTEVSWELNVPQGVDAVQYKVVAKAGNFSDGEQNVLPVLSNRILVTETLPMYVRSGETKVFNLEKLKTTNSETLQHHQLTLEVTSNPAWYAIQALPYLMEFPHECAEQTFSRYYANALATHIANSNPKIRQVFEQWSSANALVSNLEKNQELKSIMIQETPWLRDAQTESEQKKRIALLFELNTMKDQLQATLNKLVQMQMPDGGFPWFSGGRSSRYITQHIASGFGHLKQLNVVDVGSLTTSVVNKMIEFLDQQILRDYEMLLTRAGNIETQAKTKAEGAKNSKEYLQRKHVEYDHIQYLYMRTFFPDVKLDEKASVAVEYYKNQSAVYWTEFNLYMKGMIALVHHRHGNKILSKDIMRSLKESSITSEEMGMYWKENKAGWYWHEAPVETQALLIEAFAEIEDHEKQKTIDELRIWLLKNKQTSQWKSTKATTGAIYALLINGTDWLAIDKQIEVTIDNKKITPDTNQPEAGTGYFKTSWKAEDIKPAMGEIKLTKKEDGIAWAGLYWQYFEDMDKVTSAETPLRLAKKVFIVSRTDKGELLTEVNSGTALKVGDLLRIRIELTADRAMEFLHMKDMRASGLEPVDVLSAYKWQENLGYYQSTKDASTNFFFDHVAQGVYIFEYYLRVNNKGNFANGITTIQCMYAPEFSSHSEGIRISVE